MNQVTFIKIPSVVCHYILPWSFRKVYTEVPCSDPLLLSRNTPAFDIRNLLQQKCPQVTQHYSSVKLLFSLHAFP